MITEEHKQAIASLHAKDVPIRKISQLLKLSRNTVKRVIRGWQRSARCCRHDDLEVRIREVFASVGNVERVREILADEGHEVAYSTLTRIVRDLESGERRNVRVPIPSDLVAFFYLRIACYG